MANNLPDFSKYSINTDEIEAKFQAQIKRTAEIQDLIIAQSGHPQVQLVNGERRCIREGTLQKKGSL